MPATATYPSNDHQTEVVHTHGKIRLKKDQQVSLAYAVCPICGDHADTVFLSRIERYVSRTYHGAVYGAYVRDQDRPEMAGHYDCVRAEAIAYLDAIALVEN